MQKQIVKDKKVCITRYEATQLHKAGEWLEQEASGERTE